MKKKRLNIIKVLYLINTILLGISCINFFMAYTAQANQISIIGGSDGPTKVFVNGTVGYCIPLYFVLVLFIVGTILIRFRIKKSNN